MAHFNKGFYCKFKSQTFGGEAELHINTNKKAQYHDVLDEQEETWGFYLNKVSPHDGKKYKFLISAKFDEEGDTTNQLQVDVYDASQQGAQLCKETITQDKIMVWNIR